MFSLLVGCSGVLSTSVPIEPKLGLPLVSLGTGSGQHADVVAATKLWISIGGTAIDTAYIYQDEKAIADGMAQSGVKPSALFLTTKIPCGTYAQAARDIRSNLQQLNVPAVNLTLIHFPRCHGRASVAETWRALEDAKAAGTTGAIGVSNFAPSDLKALQKTAKLWPPALNQCSMSVGYHDDETIAYCDAHKIVYMAYSPLCGGSNGSSCTHGSVMTIPEVQAIAASHNVSAAQVALKWIVQQGRPLATAVAKEEYAREDLDLWSWGNLSDDEMKTLAAIKSPVEARMVELPPP